MTELYNEQRQHLMHELVHAAMQLGEHHWPGWGYRTDLGGGGAIMLTMTWNPWDQDGHPLPPRTETPIVYNLEPNPNWQADDYHEQWHLLHATRVQAWKSHKKSHYDGGGDWPYLAVPYSEECSNLDGLIQLVRHDTAYYQRQPDTPSQQATKPAAEPDPAGTLFA